MKRIGIYVGKNLLRIILLLFAVSILTFALVSASPIDPLQANVGQAALGSMSEEQKEKLRCEDMILSRIDKTAQNKYNKT